MLTVVIEIFKFIQHSEYVRQVNHFFELFSYCPNYQLQKCYISPKFQASSKNYGLSRGISLNLTLLYGFSKNVSSRERVRPWFFIIINIHIFTATFTEIPEIVLKLWRFPLSILTIFIDFLYLLIFPCYIETHDIIT